MLSSLVFRSIGRLRVYLDVCIDSMHVKMLRYTDLTGKLCSILMTHQRLKVQKQIATKQRDERV